MKENLVRQRILESVEVKTKIANNSDILLQIQHIGDLVAIAIEQGYKVLVCGNGGSASDAIHIVAELVGKFQKKRMPYKAIALNTNIANLTAISNDFGYESVFSRQVEGIMEAGDVLIAISTSGNSSNILNAVLAGNEVGGTTVALTGGDGGELKKVAKYSIVVPSQVVARVQEVHIMLGHIICEIIEERLT